VAKGGSRAGAEIPTQRWCGDFLTAMASTESNGGGKRIQFGPFEADLSTGELFRSGMHVRLQGQPFKLLVVLAEHPGKLMSREELERELWGDDTTVDFDHCLSIAINKLREALGDTASNPRFIQTLARRGYRFIAPVKTIYAEAIPDAVQVLPTASSNSMRTSTSPMGRFWPLLAAGLAVLCLILSALLYLR
jgi:DNA-binding winged helix-turn-helix (wHTH) protein